METLKPPALKKGDTIGVISTSCWLEKSDLLSAQDFLKQNGYDAFHHPQALARLNQSAGSAQEKITAFHELFADPDIKMIMGARGGNRAITMLDKIDFDLIRQNPKILIGYSDMTTLLNGVYAKCGLVTFHGPLYRELPTHKNFQDMIDMVSGKTDRIDLPGSELLKPGATEGKLFGGNLSLFQTLIGTDLLPDLDGAILFLEDVADHLSRYDRMFGHLRISGLLHKISGLIVGQFTETKDSEERPFGFTLKDIVEEHTAGLDIPVLFNAPFGHGEDLPTFPVGCRARLDSEGLTLLESPVS